MIRMQVENQEESMPDKKEHISLSRFTVYHSAEDLSRSEHENEFKEEPGDSCVLMNEAKAKSGLCNKERTMFNDGVSSVDFVLVWSDKNNSEEDIMKRQIFEKNLRKEGLKLEREKNAHLNFVKISASENVLMRYCEILKLRLPMKKIPGEESSSKASFDIMLEVKSFFSRCLQCVKVDPTVFAPIENRFLAEFSRDKTYLFDMGQEDFFSPAVRSSVVNFILSRQKFSASDDDQFAFGINRLINDDVYLAAYPLHDGDYKKEGSMRHLLYTEWASIKQCIKQQPLDHIKEYFGVKIALYFAWLGFYTYMLIPASIVGLIVFLYGAITINQNKLSEDICNSNITMCPLCDKECDYWQLNETCMYSRISYLFDNPSTVFFAIFMSFWCAVFLEFWKRYSSGIVHRWGQSSFTNQAEQPRPEYLIRLRNSTKYRINPVTQIREPYAPFWSVRVPYVLMSFSVIFFLIFIAIAAVFGVVLYRMAILTSRKLYGDSDNTSYIIMFIPATAGVINLICIFILNMIYTWVANRLTEQEFLRTQTEFDESLTVKIYLFQFVNYYTCIFYIALLKGKFVGYPSKYNRIAGLRQEECSPGGCLMELCIQLAIIMIGKQALNAFLEMFTPILTNMWMKFRIKTGLKEENIDTKILDRNQWTRDFVLIDFGSRGLFSEYLEMIIQFGFVTIFVAAFPLAPLFALINNVFEMRLDAQKFLRFIRRPVPFQCKDIGVWYKILEVLGRIAVVTNALIIAFSSNFIPRIVYMMKHSPDGTDNDFLNFTLSYFDTKDFPPESIPVHPTINHTHCWYSEYRNPPWAESKYKRPPVYWHILAARLAFVIIFQNIVSFLIIFVQWVIPDIPLTIRDAILREAFLKNERIMKHERFYILQSQKSGEESGSDSEVTVPADELSTKNEGYISDT